MTTVYLAGGISGMSYEEACAWRRTATTLLTEYGFAILDPMRGKEMLQDVESLSPQGYAPEGPLSGKSLTRRDLHDIESADAVLFNFLGATERSVGSLIELGYSASDGCHIVVIMERDNVHDHIFVKELADVVVPRLDDALTWLRHYYNG